MKPPITAENLDGIIPPVITPFNDEGQVDEDAYRSELRHVSQYPIGAVLVGAATGEGYALKPDETALLCGLARDVLGKAVPIIAGVLAPSAEAAAEYGSIAANAGADALMVTAPTYFPSGLQSLQDHYRMVADSSGLPLMIYNALPHVPLDPITLTHLAQLPEVVAIKQGMGGTLAELRILIEEVGDSVCVMFSQDQLLYPAYCLGARGSLASIDAILPDLTTAMLTAVRDGNLPEARKLDAAVSCVARTLGPTDWPAAVKYAVELQGRPAGRARAPYTLSDQRRQEIRAALQKAGVIAS